MKDEILESVKEYAEHDPSIYGDLLQMIGANWNAMVTEQQQQRSNKNIDALRFSILPVKIPRNRKWNTQECVAYLHVLEALYPNAEGRSVREKQLLECLAESCRAMGWMPCDRYIKIIEKENFLQKLYEKHPVKPERKRQ